MCLELFLFKSGKPFWDTLYMFFSRDLEHPEMNRPSPPVKSFYSHLLTRVQLPNCYVQRKQHKLYHTFFGIAYYLSLINFKILWSELYTFDSILTRNFIAFHSSQSTKICYIYCTGNIIWNQRFSKTSWGNWYICYTHRKEQSDLGHWTWFSRDGYAME